MGYRLMSVTGTSGVRVVAGAIVVSGAAVDVGGVEDSSGAPVVAQTGHTGQLVAGICQAPSQSVNSFRPHSI